MRKPWVGGNWKMNGSLATNRALFEGFVVPESVECAIFPSQMYLLSSKGELSSKDKNAAIAIGAQMISDQESGAFTGQISAQMIKDAELDYALVGHSECRELLGVTNAMTATKVQLLINAGITPVLCIGEKLEARQSEQTEAIIKEQLQPVLAAIDAATDFIIAYEPVWAIGTGMAATAEQAQETHAFIRSMLAEKSQELADKTRIVYGGSVNTGNADSLFAMSDIDGGLIGGASLKEADFNQILHVASQSNLG